MKPLFVPLTVLLPLTGCALMMSNPKPLPPAVARDAALEQAAMDTIARSGINADAIHARVVGPTRVEQNQLTGLPVKRYVDIAVAVRSRVLENRCSWSTIRFSQRHAGGGTYAQALTKEVTIDSGKIDCKDPQLSE